MADYCLLAGCKCPLVVVHRLVRAVRLWAHKQHRQSLVNLLRSYARMNVCPEPVLVNPQLFIDLNTLKGKQKNSHNGSTCTAPVGELKPFMPIRSSDAMTDTR